ncbi:DUF3226 domain-containing protein [Cystobacter fuscus]|uniref:DUF3226 domain-containing protein n=1 Tax=Cystobacter fuscus TaxID=43 RepID=UPI002B2B4E9F|nr:hypothetical protein F0U63_42590 [Cystobacter fuscus]
MHHVYFAVEGPHDLEFVGRFLKLHGLKRVQHKPRLTPFWTPLLPKSWPSPPGSTDLLKRVPVPVFFQNQHVSVAIDSVTGDSQLLSSTINTRGTVEQPGGEILHSIGIVLDSDQNESAMARFNTIAKGLNAERFPLATVPGQVVEGPPRLGIFVLPDNATAGTLEDLLIECAETQYPQLLASARIHVESVQSEVPPYEKSDLEDFLSPAGRRKAVVGSIGSILRPGKSIQISIQDNRWVDGDALALPRVKMFRAFVDALLAPLPSTPIKDAAQPP